MKHKNKTENNLLKHKSYFSYLYFYISKFPLSARFKEIYIFLRKFFLISRIFRYTRYILLFIQTGANFLLFASFFLFLFPIIILLIAFIFIYTTLKFSKYNKTFSKLIKQYKFIIYFSNEYIGDDIIFEISQNKNIIIIVEDNPTKLLPSFIKKMADNTFLISTCYFYSLKKHVLSKHKRNCQWKGKY